MGTKGRAAKTILAWTAAIAVLSAHYACAQQLERGLIVDLVSLEVASPITLQAPIQSDAQENATPSATQSPRSPNQRSLPVVDPNIDFSQFAVPAPASNPLSNDAQAESRDGIVQQVEAAVEPELMQPWWSEQLVMPDNVEARRFDLDQLIWLAMSHSPYVQSVLVEPEILQTRATAALGVFDPTTFMDTIFRDTSDPVGNTLITGSANRLNEHAWDSSSGIRKRNSRGGQGEFSQQFLFKDNNSDFFIPANQADTKMVLSYTQPLMRGSGVTYNRAGYLVSQFSADESGFEANRKIQEHAFQIINAYWELYAALAIREQIVRGLDRLFELQKQLSGRADLDSIRSQQLRAGATIARQRATLAQSIAQIRSAEANLRAAIAAPELLESNVSIVPGTLTNDWKAQPQLANELSLALNNHPDILAIRANIKAARIRLHVAEQDLRPTLDLVLEGYVRGLNGAFDAAKSYGDQFSEGAPSYSAGLSYARPYRNTAAQAILRERRLELRQVLLQLDHTLLMVGADVESAVASVESAFQQLESAVQSTMATHAELEYLQARWRNAFLDGTQTSLLLDQLLNAEIQLIQAENNWARAQADNMLAIAKLQLATGSLLPMANGPPF